MSTTLNVSAFGGASSWPRRLHANLKWAVATIVLAPHRRTNPAWRRASRLVPTGILMLGAIAAAMFYVDGWVAQTALWAPYWLWAVFEEMTEFGRSGWFLWPTGLFVMAIALFSSPAMAHAERLMVAIVGLRVGFLFVA